LWDAGHTQKLYESKKYVDPNSKGNRGKGNIFILQRMLGSVNANNYLIEITDKNGTVLTTKLHNFSGGTYDINNPQDGSNRISCNACHSKDGGVTPIFVDFNKQNLCQ
ncbi:MAG: hypothetical protein Q9M34_06500, partial [Sulfurimonas sp.]|nr:hypothetical protein [Sulfurimonas sp.]